MTHVPPKTSESQLDTPILLLAFNRPDPTQRVLAAIKEMAPKNLYISLDGPRPHIPGEIKRCEMVLKMAQSINGSLKVNIHRHKKNLGCKHAVNQGIQWFFDHVKEGIILEDDCLPNVSFFRFCNTLLKKYRQDTRVGFISGTNALGSYKSDRFDYHFGTGGSIWGWATWKRAWEQYDPRTELWADNEAKQRVRDFLQNEREYFSMIHQLKKISAGKLDTWDYQWGFFNKLNNFLSIVPSKNMIENIGFDATATHTLSQSTSRPISHDLSFPLRHPPYVAVDRVLSQKQWEQSFNHHHLLYRWLSIFLLKRM